MDARLSAEDSPLTARQESSAFRTIETNVQAHCRVDPKQPLGEGSRGAASKRSCEQRRQRLAHQCSCEPLASAENRYNTRIRISAQPAYAIITRLICCVKWMEEESIEKLAGSLPSECYWTDLALASTLGWGGPGMSRERFQSTGKSSFYGDYLYDRVVPRGDFLRKCPVWGTS